MIRRTARLIALMCLMVFLWVPAAQATVYISEEPPADWQERDLLRLTQFKLHACDGMLLEVNGQTMLIDGGTAGYREYLAGRLAEKNITRVDYLFNTHPHDDHIRNMYQLVRRDQLTAGEYLMAFREGYNDKNHKQMLALAKEKGIPYRQMVDGDTLQMGNATLTFIQAPKGDLNARSMMTHIRYGDSTILLTADISGQAQHHFLANVPPELLDVQILKEPHHGLVRMVEDFIDATSPEFVFITNKITSIPNATNQLKNHNIPRFHTSLGTVVMETDGIDWYIRQDKGQ